MTMNKLEPMPTTAQVRKFFALAKDLGASDIDAKERAKMHFKVKSFTNITQAQLSELMEMMLKKLGTRDIHSHKFVCDCGVSLVVEE